jgi:hypothetical protein
MGSIGLLVIITIIITSIFVSATLEITEVMYAPTDGNEWVEVYNHLNTSINMSNWELTDNKNTDQLTYCGEMEYSILLESNQYAIITDQDTTLYDSLETNVLKICVDDLSIGNGLSNTGDSIKIHFQDHQDLISYTSKEGALKNGKTLERENGVLRESYVDGGSPGARNSKPPKEEIVVEEEPKQELEEEQKQEPEEDKSKTKEPIENTQKSSPKFEIKFPNTTVAGSELDLKFNIYNGDSQHNFKVWAYIYRGSKCYSCHDKEREDNQQLISLEPRELGTLKFNFKLPEDMETGIYKLKVRVFKDEQATPRDFKEVLKVTAMEKEELQKEEEKKSMEEPIEEIKEIVEEVKVEKKIQEPTTESEKERVPNKITGEVIYESKNGKIKKVLPFILVVVFGLLSVVFVLKR